jgi:hypothetical protein
MLIAENREQVNKKRVLVKGSLYTHLKKLRTLQKKHPVETGRYLTIACHMKIFSAVLKMPPSGL